MTDRHSDGAGRPGKSFSPLLPGLIALFGVVLFANLSASLRSGRLAAPPGYDDVVYLSDAFDRVQFEMGNGLSGLLVSFWEHPPHAPVSALTAMIGYGLLGPSDLSVYIANGWTLALFIGFAAHVTRPLESAWLRLLLVALLTYVPIAHGLVTDFRPDMVGGLVFAIAIFTVTRTDFRKAPWSRLALAMALGVAATVVKPTACIVSIPGFGFACAATLAYQAFARERGWRSLLAGGAKALLLYAVFLLPFVVIFGESTRYYVTQVLFTYSDVWRTEGDRWFHLTFHLLGTGPVRALGPFRLVALTLVVIDLAVWFARPGYRRPETTAYAATLVVVYAAMTFSNEKTLFQGSFFYIPLLFGGLAALVRLVAWFGRDNVVVRPVVTAAIALALAVAVLAMPLSGKPYSRLPAGEAASELRPLVAKAIVRVYTEEWAGSADCRDHIPKVTVTNPYPITAESIRMEVARYGVRIGMGSYNMLRRIDEARPAMDTMDFVVTADPAVKPDDENLPISRLIGGIFDYLSQRPDTQKIAIGTYRGQPYWLFARPLCRPAPAFAAAPG